jgi:quercetin dioxygenase-like cupin family protein
MDFHHVDDTQGEFLPAELAVHFQGKVRLQPFTSPFADGPNIFAVHFPPGGRTRPHTHGAGQILQVTAGEGIIATAAERRVVGPGDIAVVMPGEWHWHGATPTSSMTHVTTQMPGPDAVDWEVEERDWATDYDA